MVPPTKTRTVLSVEDKIRLLEMANDKRKTTSEILTHFSIGLSTFHKIKAKENLIRQSFVSNKKLNRKRNKGSTYNELNKALTHWFHQVRAKNAIVNGPLVMEKAQQLANAMGVDFKPSNGWLQRWKEGENIAFHSVQGEKAECDGPAAEQWIQSVLPTIISGYEKCNIYNADESGIFYKALPRGTFTVCGDQPTAGKLQKERLTALFLCNEDGSDKQLFIIGKRASPRCFKNIRRPPLPYYSNKKAWMTSSIWMEILGNFDKKLKLQKRNILLFVDNVACHKLLDTNLTNIKVVFLPPNTSCLIQPLDQGIIKNAKIHYRQLLLREQIVAIDNGQSLIDFVKSVTLLKAIHWLQNAWSKVKPETIKNCFRKAGFPCDSNDKNIINIVQPVDTNFQLQSITLGDFNEWVACDENLECYGELSDADIIAIVRQKENDLKVMDDDDEPETIHKPSRQEVISALATLRSYYDVELGEGYEELHAVENRVIEHMHNRLLQPKITDYFC